MSDTLDKLKKKFADVVMLVESIILMLEGLRASLESGGSWVYR